MSSWTPPKQLLTTSITLASISVILYAGSLVFVSNQIEEVEKFYSDSDSEFAQIAKAQAISSIVASNEEEIQTLRQFFVQRGDEVDFIESIEKLARSSGVSSEIASIQTKPTSSFKEDIEIDVNVEGSWVQIMKFINNLEKASFGIVVRDIKLEESGRSRWSGSIKVVLFREL